MQDFEKLFLSKMADIQGLQEVSSFPLPIGDKIIIALLVVMVFYFLYKYIKHLKFKKSWKFWFLQSLEQLEADLKSKAPKDILDEFNETLKRFCITKFSRKEVASLNGKKFLRWLTLRDPNGFDWSKKGIILSDYPYMPPEKISIRKGEVKILIKALKEWV